MLRNKQHPGLQGRRLWDSQAISWQQAPYVLQKQTTLLFLSVKMQHSIFLDFITTAVNFLLFPPIFLLLSKFTFQEKKKTKTKKTNLRSIPYWVSFSDPSSCPCSLLHLSRKWFKNKIEPNTMSSLKVWEEFPQSHGITCKVQLGK